MIDTPITDDMMIALGYSSECASLFRSASLTWREIFHLDLALLQFVGISSNEAQILHDMAEAFYKSHQEKLSERIEVLATQRQQLVTEHILGVDQKSSVFVRWLKSWVTVRHYVG